MEVVKKYRVQSISMIGIIIISICEVLALYKLNVVYKGVHLVSYFGTVIIIQIFCWYRLIFKVDVKKKRYKSSIVFMILITVSTPVLMLVTQPQYSFQDGKVLIKNNIHEKSNYTFIEHPDWKNTIPVTNNLKSIFINNRVYYYRLSDGVKINYFIVNPISGRVNKLDKGYWSEDQEDN
ncbi:MAG: hypothetical protein FH753_04685 [Firmicutes bacterium]|nr:hypothetical protein [Bacillota bacterium]